MVFLHSAMGSDKNKELFLSQVTQILEGVKQDRDKVREGCGAVRDQCCVCPQLEQKRNDEKGERDRLNGIYLELVEQQRAYYKSVRDFQEVGRQCVVTHLNMQYHSVCACVYHICACYVFMYVCTHVCMCVHMCAYYIRVFLCICTHVCGHVCMCADTRAHVSMQECRKNEVLLSKLKAKGAKP